MKSILFHLFFSLLNKIATKKFSTKTKMAVCLELNLKNVPSQKKIKLMKKLLLVVATFLVAISFAQSVKGEEITFTYVKLPSNPVTPKKRIINVKWLNYQINKKRQMINTSEK
jgi:hypothetical protein